MSSLPVYARLGSISSATHRPEDLIPAFLEALSELADDLSLSLDSTATADETESVKREVQRLQTLMADIEQRMSQPGYFDGDSCCWDLNETLFDELGAFAPPYCYFGAHPGDGADFGFWLSEHIETDFDGLRVADLSEVPDDYSGEVLDVNDHGNATLYSAVAGELTEIWAIV